MLDWAAQIAREERRYLDGLERLPGEADTRQRQLVRVANAACGAGLSCLMAGLEDDAHAWFRRSAERYRESYDGAPTGSFGRMIGAVKMRLLAADATGLLVDAGWTLGEVGDDEPSPIGRYAACLARLALGQDVAAAALASSLQAEPEDRFPGAVADALAAIAAADAGPYRIAIAGALASFERRSAYLEDVPVADTVLALEALARPRGIQVAPRSALLPRAAG